MEPGYYWEPAKENKGPRGLIRMSGSTKHFTTLAMNAVKEVEAKRLAAAGSSSTAAAVTQVIKAENDAKRKAQVQKALVNAKQSASAKKQKKTVTIN